MRRAAKRDANEPEIIRAFKARGWSVQQVSERGCPDLLVGRGRVLLLVEVKGKGAKLTPDQRTWFEAWQGPLPVIVRSVSDVDVLTEALK